MKKIRSFFGGILSGISSWIQNHPITMGVFYGVLVAAILSASHYFASAESYDYGYDSGKVDGRCEMMCAYLGMGYDSYSDDPSACWCRTPYGEYYPLPYIQE